MNIGRTVFAQIMDFLPLHTFRACVSRYQGDYKIRKFSCLDQFLSMAFAQLTYRESLRDIEACLRSMQIKLYHMGIRGKVSRSTLAKANETRDWRIYRDFAHVLIRTARELYKDEPFGAELEQTAYALDSTTIELCLSLFPWARFRKDRAAIKLHTLLDLRGNIPSFIQVTKGKLQDVLILDDLVIEPGAFYILDRGYFDFVRLHMIATCSAFFIVRAKKSLRFQRLYSHPVDKTTGLICDQTIMLSYPYTLRDYPEKLRRIRYHDMEKNKYFTFLTNHFNLPALTVCQAYKCRWQAELFFKWIKQHLRIKAFCGTSENAVKTQVWIAISIYVLVSVIKKRLNLDASLYTILQILSITLFEKTSILQVLTEFQGTTETYESNKQLLLFDL